MRSLKTLDKKAIGFFLACIVVSTAIFIYFGAQKTVWFCDEMYTYTIATNGTFGISFSEQAWCSGQDIADTFFVAKNGFDFGAVIKGTAGDNHPPAYYLFFHAIAVLVGKYSKWIGLFVNYVFFIGCITILFWGVHSVCKKPAMAFLAGIVFSSNGGILSNALLIRMYMMMVFFVFVYLLLMFKLFRGSDKTCLYVQIAGVTILGFLTNYVFVIYLFFFSIAYIIYSIAGKKIFQTIKYVITELLAGAIGILLFPACIEHIFVGNKGTGAFEKATDIKMLLDNILNAVKIQNQLLFSNAYLVGIVVFIVVSILFFRVQRKLKKEKYISWFAGSMIFAVVTYMITVRQVFLAENRYLYLSMYMEYVLLIFMLISVYTEIKNEKGILNIKQSGIIALTALLLFNFFQNVPNPKIEYFGTKQMKEQWEILMSERQTPWIYYGEFDWVSMYCALDFTVPEQIYAVRSDSQPKYDEVLDQSDRFIVYLNGNNVEIENLLIYLQESVGEKYKYKCMMDNRLYLKVYEVWKVQ